MSSAQVVKLNIDPAASDPNGIAEDQQPTALVPFVLNGAQSDLGTPLQWDIGDAYGDISGAQISFESTGNWASITFTITGADPDGNALVVTQAGPNNNTVTTSAYFSSITSITSSGTVATNVEVGAADALISKTIPLNGYSDYQATTAVMGLSGTIQFDVQQTFDLVMENNAYVETTGADAINWIDLVSNQSTAQVNSAALYAQGIRLVIDSYTDTAEFQFHVMQNPWD